MTDSSPLQGPHILGPRGWAVLVLAGGAALSAPFLRNPGNPPNSETIANPSEVDFSKKSWPDVREKTLIPTGSIATNLSERDWAELERLKGNSGAGPRKLTGNLPSTSATPLPSWAERGPRIDQLVNNSIHTEPLAPAPPSSTGLDSLRPWMGAGLKSNLEAAAAPQDTVAAGSGPSSPGLSGDFVFRAPNPDARWSSNQVTSPNPEVFPQDASNRDSGALASNGSFRKFEDHVKQWPDEKMLPGSVERGQVERRQVDPGHVAWGQSIPPQSDRNAVNPNSAWPPVSQPGASLASEMQVQPIQSLVAPAAMPEKPDTVSAPMVSSQSGRQPPKLNGPTIEAPKPATPAEPRQKHFIQQPAKRA